MADGTVRGAFDLDTSRARREVRDFRREAAAADAQTRQLGSTIDRAFGESQVFQIGRVSSATAELGRDTYRTRMDVRDHWRGMRRDIEKEAAGIVSTIAVVRDRMRQLGRERSSPVVDVDGITEALAQVELLHSRLNSLGRERATPRVALGGGGGLTGVSRTVVGGGGGSGRSGRSAIKSIGVGPLNLASGTGRILIGAGLPAIQAVGGGAVALGGSLGAAGLGAGATGLGALAPLVTGIGGIMAVAKPAQMAMKAAWQEQTRLTAAVQRYGQNSKQARVESERLNRLTANRPGLARATREARGFMGDWRRLTRPGQRSYYGLLGDVATEGRRVAPLLARDANRDTRAARVSGRRFANFLGGSESQDNLNFFSQTFAQELPTVERTLENVTLTMERLARAATPFFREGNDWVEKQTMGWRTSTRDIDATRAKMRPLVQSAKDWGHLLGSAWTLLRDIGKAGKPSGDSMVVSLDDTFQRWDKWIQRNPARTRQFFRQSVSSVEKMAGGLSKAVGWLHQLADVLRPILDRFSQLVGLASSLGLIGTPGAIGAVLGGVRGARQRFGGGAAQPMFLPGGGRGAPAAGAGGLSAGAIAAGGGGYLAGRGLIRTTGIPSTLGPGVQPLAGQRVYGEGFRYGGPVSQLGARTTRFGSVVRNVPGALAGGLRGAVRSFAPIGLGLGALDFASFQGSFGERAQAGLSSLTLGAIARPRTAAQRSDAAGSAVSDFLDQRVNGLAPTTRGVRTGQARINAEIARLAGQKKTSGSARFLGGDDHSIFGLIDTGGHGITDEQFKENQKRIELLRQERGELAKTNRQMERARQDRLDVRSRQRAAVFGAGLPQAYGVYRNAGQAPLTAADNTVGLVKKRLAHMRDAGVETLGEAGLDWARAMAKHNPQMKREVDALNDAIEARFRRMGKTVQIVNGDILTGSRVEWGQISDALTGAAEKARQGVSADFTAIQQKAVGSLVSMGYSRGDANKVVQGIESGRFSVAQAGARTGSGQPQLESDANLARSHGYKNPLGGGKKERGGVIGGRGLMDTIRTPDGGMAAPGEAWIANRHTLADMSRATVAMYGRTAQQMIRGETRQHWKSQRYATGGVTPAVANLIRQLGGKGFHAGSTTGGTHAPNSYHYRGMAVDYGDASNDMRRLWSVVFPQRRRFAEMFGPNYLTPKPTLMHYGSGFSDPALQAQHNNHIHLALAGGGAVGSLKGGGGGGRAKQIHLRGVGARQAGAPGLIRQRAGDIFAAGLQGKINRVLRRAGGDGLGGFSGGGDSTANMRLGHRMMLASGWGEDQWPSLRALWQRESGWNSHARNASSGAFGIPQSLPASKMGAAAVGGDPVAQIRWGLRYIRGRYGSPAGAWAHEQSAGWYARGGKTRRADWGGMFDRGGTITTNGPTMFMAGEGSRRRERVTVTPAGSGRGGHGGGVNLTIEAGAVVVKVDGGVRSDADIEALAKKVGGRVVEKIVEAIDKRGVGVID